MTTGGPVHPRRSLENPRVRATTPECMDAEYQLLIARRRAEQCQRGGPAWDAAMGLVDELEAEVRRIDQEVTPRTLLAVDASSR